MFRVANPNPLGIQPSLTDEHLRVFIGVICAYSGIGLAHLTHTPESMGADGLALRASHLRYAAIKQQQRKLQYCFWQLMFCFGFTSQSSSACRTEPNFPVEARVTPNGLLLL